MSQSFPLTNNSNINNADNNDTSHDSDSLIDSNTFLSHNDELLLTNQYETLLLSLNDLTSEQQNKKLLSSHYQLYRELFITKEKYKFEYNKNLKLLNLTKQFSTQTNSLNELVKQMNNVNMIEDNNDDINNTSINNTIINNSVINNDSEINDISSLTYDDYQSMLSSVQSQITKEFNEKPSIKTVFSQFNFAYFNSMSFIIEIDKSNVLTTNGLNRNFLQYRYK